MEGRTYYLRRMRLLVNGVIGQSPDLLPQLLGRIRRGRNLIVPESGDPGLIRLLVDLFGSDGEAPYDFLIVSPDSDPDMPRAGNIRVIRADSTSLLQFWREQASPRIFCSAGTRGGVGKTTMAIGVAMRARMDPSVAGLTIIDADANRTLSRHLEGAFGLERGELNIFQMSRLGKGKQSGSLTTFLVSPAAAVSEADQITKLSVIRDSLDYALRIPSDFIVVDLPGQVGEAGEMIGLLISRVREAYTSGEIRISLAISSYASKDEMDIAMNIARHARLMIGDDAGRIRLVIGVFLHHGADDHSTRKASEYVREGGKGLVDLVIRQPRLPLRQWDLMEQIRNHPAELSTIATDPGDSRAWIGDARRFFSL